METNAFVLRFTPPPLPIALYRRLQIPQTPFQHKFPSFKVVRSIKQKDLDEYGIPKEYDPECGLPKEVWDDEWQARQQEKTKELHQKRQEEEDEERRKEAEYREIGKRLMGYPEEEVRNARRLVSSFIRSAEEVEEKIEEAAEKGELTELVLMVIWNRLDLARRDDEKDAIRSLDLLYRRVETEILKREATPSMRLLNDLLNLHDGFDDEEWLKKCRKCMIDTFPREDPFSILVPAAPRACGSASGG
ncbi:pale cress protein (PAC) isoform X2 [Tasmannia lanceolata]|uniref:pale cress protein (PAC) isoform X2 n=1 Tax=Tasmannia lanceolata TaxID=3420 RepID=UPI004063C5E3